MCELLCILSFLVVPLALLRAVATECKTIKSHMMSTIELFRLMKSLGYKKEESNGKD